MLSDGVIDSIAEALTLPGNPSSQHAEGRAALKLIDASRRKVAAALGADAADVVFTSGGTEANALGLIGLARLLPSTRKRVLMPQVVHPSLWAAGLQLEKEGYSLEVLPVDRYGNIDVEASRAIVRTGEVGLLAFGLANHELGAVEDSKEVVELGRECGALIFCDAVQAWGRVVVDVGTLEVDALSVSAHKIGGPKGVGALWIRTECDVRPMVGGGGQESGRRPGTQACGLIAGFGAAADQLTVRLADSERQSLLRDEIASRLLDLGAVLYSSASGLCNTICARFPGIRGDLLVSNLDLMGIAISTGSACSSGTLAVSSVLLGIGLPESSARECIRLSIGPGTGTDEIEALFQCLPAILERIRRFS